MAILAVSSLERAQQLVHEDDQSVVAGVLEATVRPWRVVMAPALTDG